MSLSKLLFLILLLQENNAVATVDLINQNITGVHGLGFKDWSKLTLDPSDKDRGRSV